MKMDAQAAINLFIKCFAKVPIEDRRNALKELHLSLVPPHHIPAFVDAAASDRPGLVYFELEGFFNSQSMGLAVEMIPLMYPFFGRLSHNNGHLYALDVSPRTAAGTSLFAGLFGTYHSRVATYFDTVDVDPTYNEYQLSRWSNLNRAIVGDVFNLASGSYDFVICSHLLAHVGDLGQYCRELQNLAKQYVFIYCPYQPLLSSRWPFMTDSVIDEIQPIAQHIQKSWWSRGESGEPLDYVFLVLPGCQHEDR